MSSFYSIGARLALVDAGLVKSAGLAEMAESAAKIMGRNVARKSLGFDAPDWRVTPEKVVEIADDVGLDEVVDPIAEELGLRAEQPVEVAPAPVAPAPVAPAPVPAIAPV